MEKYNTPERYLRPAFLFGVLMVGLSTLAGCSSNETSAMQANNLQDCPSDTYVPTVGEYIPIQIQPEIIYQPPLKYPRMAYTAGLEGNVIVQVLICENGDVIEAQTGMSSGVSSLDEAALNQARATKFSPAIQGLHPVKIWVTYRVEFRLQ